MAEGLVRTHPAMVKPVVEFCLKNDINIVQMPCPETSCAAGGLGRLPRGKIWYEQNGLRETSKEIARGQLDYLERLLSAGMNVLAFIGIEFSPACAVNFLNKGRSIVRDEGIYIEELKKGMAERGFSIPFIGVAPKWNRRLDRDLQALLDPPQADRPWLSAGDHAA